MDTKNSELTLIIQDLAGVILEGSVPDEQGGYESGQVILENFLNSFMEKGLYDPNNVAADVFLAINQIYDNSISGITAENVQSAIDEVLSEIDDIEVRVTQNESDIQLLFNAQISNFTDLLDVPENYIGAAGEKLVVNTAENALIFLPSTTSSGFYDVSTITFNYDNITKELSILGAYSFVSNSGSKFTKTNDVIIIMPVDGLIYIYYDDNGNLQQLANPNRDLQYVQMNATLPVAYLTYNISYGNRTFIGDYMKTRVSTGLWVKNFYDNQIYVFAGLNVFGLTGGPGTSNSDVQLGLSEAELLFVTRKYNIPTRAETDTWNVGFFNNSPTAIGVEDNTYMVLTDIDLGIGLTGRIVHNNDGSPSAVNSGNYVWYFIMVTNDVTPENRTLSFMGNSQFGNIASAEDGLSAEIEAIETKLLIRQGARLTKAVLFETKSTFTNAVKGRIEEVLEIISESGGSVQSASIPAELINGSKTTLHSHYYHNIVEISNGVATSNTATSITVGDIAIDRKVMVDYTLMDLTNPLLEESGRIEMLNTIDDKIGRLTVITSQGFMPNLLKNIIGNSIELIIDDTLNPAGGDISYKFQITYEKL